MKKTIETEVMTFDELNEKAKEKARQWYREGAYDDFTFAWQQVQDDAEMIGLKLESYDTCSASFVRNMKGDFTDGAFNCANKILSEHGEECETYKTAAAYLKQWHDLPAADGEESRTDDYDAIEGDFLESLLKDYSAMLQKELDYTYSDEHVDDMITANEYTFTETGKRFG